RDQIRLTSNVSEAGASRHRELCRVVESRVIESAFAVHFEIRDESVPMCHGTPTRPGVKVHAGQAECGRDQRRGRLSIIAKGFAIKEKFGVKLSRSPAAGTLRTVDCSTPNRLATVDKSGASAMIAPTLRSRFAHPSSRRPIPGSERVINRRMTQCALDSDGLDRSLRVEESGYANDRVQPKQSQGSCRISEINTSFPD